jgi:hypothetical protein
MGLQVPKVEKIYRLVEGKSLGQSGKTLHFLGMLTSWLFFAYLIKMLKE